MEVNNVTSNSLIDLADQLILTLKEQNDFFTTRTVIVPNKKIAKWFKAYWMKKTDEVLMNVEFITFNNSFLKLLDVHENKTLASKEEIKLLVIKYLNQYKVKLPEDVRKYIFYNEEIDGLKIYNLATELTTLFNEYENDLFKITGYQEKIYVSVIDDLARKNKGTLASIVKNNYLFKNPKNIYVFGFSEFTNLQKHLIENCLKTFNLVKKDNKINKCKIVSAPSKIREVESLHSKICQLLKDNPKLSFNDMLVVCPSLNDYECAIRQVFKQDDINFINIPCSFNNSKRGNGNLEAVLRKLIEIYNKKFFTRNDFYEIVSNPLIKYLRGIDDQENYELADAIIKMNIYRNSIHSDDWNYAKKRVLLSKLTSNNNDENYVELEDGYYIPYSSISLNDDLIVKLVNVINDLNSWCKTLSSIKYINEENLELIRNELDKWFLDKVGTIEKNYYYDPLISTINNWKDYGVSKDEIPLNTLLFSLLSASSSITLNKGDLFLDGVSFVEYDDKTIYAADYVFLIGIGAQDLPIRKIKSELDLRTDDISNISLQYDKFVLTCQNASRELYISYLGKNLKSDEKLFMSPFLTDLMDENGIKKENIIHMHLDEDERREWNVLFTKREYKNKEYYYGLLKNDADNKKPNDNQIESKEKDRRIRLSSLSTFLNDPLQFAANKAFGYEDDFEEKVKEEYEPFTLTPLESKIVEKEVVLYLIDEKKTELEKSDIDKIIKKFDLNHTLPYICNEIKEATILRIKDICDKRVKWVYEKTENNFCIKSGVDFVFNYNDEQYTLFNEELFIVSEKNDEVKYIEVAPSDKEEMKKKKHKLCKLYVFSLFDIAQKNDGEYKVDIIRNDEVNASYSLTPSLAKEIIIKIFVAMNSNDNYKCFPLEIEDIKELNLNELAKKLNGKNGNPWIFFKHGKLFDKEKQIGYTEEDFADEFNAMRTFMQDLIIFLNKEEGGCLK